MAGAGPNPPRRRASRKSAARGTAPPEADSDDYYKVLGLDRTAGEDDIKKAYRQAALSWHPDKNPDNKEEAERRFKSIGEAYGVLSDLEKRGMYDRGGKEALRGGSSSGGASDGRGGDDFFGEGFDPFRIFEQFFGGGDPFADMFAHMGMGRQRGVKRSRGAGSTGPMGFGPMGFGSMFGGGDFSGGGFSDFGFFSSGSGGAGTASRSTTTTRTVNGKTRKVTETSVRQADGSWKTTRKEQSATGSGGGGMGIIGRDPFESFFGGGFGQGRLGF